jgi:hypothetical protein
MRATYFIGTIESTPEKILASLFNNAKTQGMGALHYVPSHVMTESEALSLLKDHSDFDYLEGRVMKIRFTEDKEISVWGYDRDNGEGSAHKALSDAVNN